MTQYPEIVQFLSGQLPTPGIVAPHELPLQEETQHLPHPALFFLYFVEEFDFILSLEETEPS